MKRVANNGSPRGLKKFFRLRGSKFLFFINGNRAEEESAFDTHLKKN